MVYTYGAIDIIVKSRALNRVYNGAKRAGKNEGIRSGFYDAELVCFPLGMDPMSACAEAQRLSKLYGFSLPSNNSADNSDSVIVEGFGGPTTECNWIEEITHGVYQMKSNITEWDSEKWLKDFKAASSRGDTHPARRAVFKYTQEISEKGEYIKKGKKITISDPDKSIVYDSKINLPDDVESSSQKTVFEVVNEDCLAVARKLKDENPLVLNMASRRTPGGGVVNGAGAQEECLFRSSNYYKSLYQADDKYPMDRDFGGIYTSNVTVFRDLENKGYGLLDEPFKTNFVAVAAIRNPDLTSSGHLTAEMKKGVRNKIQTILDIAVLHGHKTLILSAFGCGAFHNPPEDIAVIFKEFLEKDPYVHFFNKVVFAIKSDHNDKQNHNFTTFNTCF